MLVNILKSLWSVNAGSAGSGAGVLKSRERMADDKVVLALLELVKGNNVILIGEGIMGLILVARNDAGRE